MTYVATVLADAPLHYWRFADPGGFIVHDIGSDRWHMLSNPSAQLVGYTGIAADGGAFLCANAAQAWTSDTKLRQSPLTVECWVYVMSNRGGNTLDILRWDSNVNPFLNLGYQGASHKFVWNAGNVTVLDPTPHNPQAWHHLVGVYDNAALSRLYVDAIQVGTGAPTGAINDAQIIQWGVTSGALGSHVVTEAAIYTHVLTPAAISAHFLAADSTGAPVFQLPGVTAANGGFGSSDALQSEIYAAVHKTF